MHKLASALVIDHSSVPTDRHLPNEARLRNRLEQEIANRIDGILSDRGVTDLAAGGAVAVKIKLDQPTLSFDRNTGRPIFLSAGNDQFRVGDIIPKPKGNGNGNGNGPGAGQGDEEDEFVFQIDDDEMKRRILEGLALPNMEQKTIVRRDIATIERAGFQPDGSPANLDLVRSAVRATGRRRALKRPKQADLRRVQREIDQLEALEYEDDSTRRKLAELLAQQVRFKAHRRTAPYMDKGDLRYRRSEIVPQPISQAVMFALMDVSGSMGEHHKDLAKRFFWLLRMFLEREYRDVTVVYVRHTDTAQEVSEKEFFFGTKSGGTIVSSALEKVHEIIRDRFPLEQYNIYCCQAGDGDTWYNLQGQDDALASAMYLETQLMPIVQYFAYLECHDSGNLKQKKGRIQDTPLWTAYGEMRKPTHFQMKRVDDKGQIFPVFQHLFRDDETRRRIPIRA